ncbi:chitobiase/beta-hexosaminidase C-terminal domain-containing protein [Planctomycetota bacterium]
MKRIVLFILMLSIMVGPATASSHGDSPHQDANNNSSTVARPAYETETWPAGRQLVWARPGQDGAIADVNNWVHADGTPAQASPDRHTDILLPAAETAYAVLGNRLDQVRHVTIERNVKFGSRHRNEVEVWGNCHAKPGALIRFLTIQGDKHTFFRMDEGVFPNPENGQGYIHPTRMLPDELWSRTQVAHKFQICKFGTASVEFIGNIGIGDELMIQHGKLIISGDFRYGGSTEKGAIDIFDGGTLEIQSGGRVAVLRTKNDHYRFNINVYRNATLQAGSPERPLTRDAELLFSFTDNDRPGATGLYAARGSKIRVYTADPEKARLLVSSITGASNFYDGMGKILGDPQEKASGSKGVMMQLAGDVDFSHVTFDYIAKAGICLADPALRQTWAGVTFGSHCAAAASELFGDVTVNQHAYFQLGQDQYGLTSNALAAMNSYLEQADPFQISTLPPSTQIVKMGMVTAAAGRGKVELNDPRTIEYDVPIEVTINTKVPQASVRYTMDGSEPTKDSPQYSGPIRLNKTTKLMVKAYKKGVGFSPTYSTTYVFKN